MRTVTSVVAIVILTSLTCFAADPAQHLLAASGSRSWDSSLVLLTSGDMPSEESGYRLSSSEGLVPDRIAFESITSVSVDNNVIVIGPIPMRNQVVVGETLRSQARGHPL